nr:PHB depolymerase family esterase [Oceanicella actignis]
MRIRVRTGPLSGAAAAPPQGAGRAPRPLSRPGCAGAPRRPLAALARRLRAAILPAAALALAAAAQALAQAGAECGRADAPCVAAGGEYLIALPADPAPRPARDPSAPRPAVIFLHGHGGRAAAVMRNRPLVEAFLARGLAFIAPQGAPRFAGDRGGGWNARGAPPARDDAAFLSALADDAAARFGLDRRRMLLAGFSSGGMMVWRMACVRPGAFAAHAPVAGLLWRPLPARCAGPTRLLHVHGWSDRVVPLEGRAVAGGRLVQGDLFRGLALLRAAFGCARDAPDAFGRRGALLLRRWRDCAAGGELALALHPGGHRVPREWAALALDWFEGREIAP